MIMVLLVSGMIALPIGAKLTVDSATEIALTWRVPDEIIGLTIVAIVPHYLNWQRD